MAVWETAGRAGGAVSRRTKALLFFAFAFAVMADPVSSVVHAIEGGLRALHGHLGLLLPTIGLAAILPGREDGAKARASNSADATAEVRRFRLIEASLGRPGRKALRCRAANR